MGAAEIALQLAGQFGHLGGVGGIAGVERGFQQLLVDDGSALGLVALVLLPGLPAENHRQRERATREHGFAVALPPVLELRNLFFFSLHA
ncbi:hypothetical protein D3C78_325900 [compost metagenome]